MNVDVVAQEKRISQVHINIHIRRALIKYFVIYKERHHAYNIVSMISSDFNVLVIVIVIKFIFISPNDCIVQRVSNTEINLINNP